MALCNGNDAYGLRQHDHMFGLKRDPFFFGRNLELFYSHFCIQFSSKTECTVSNNIASKMPWPPKVTTRENRSRVCLAEQHVARLAAVT